MDQNESYYVTTFGSDCLGNISGYCVRERGTGRWVESFAGNIYEPGSFEQAKQDAERSAKELTLAAIRERRG